jgi:hypothetical protein
MKSAPIQLSAVVISFFGTLLLLSTGCWWTCNCPPVTTYILPDPIDSSLIEVLQHDADWNSAGWSDSTWSDTIAAELSRDGDTVTLVYTTDAGTFQVDLEVTASEEPF